jgi:hypothetical protein
MIIAGAVPGLIWARLALRIAKPSSSEGFILQTGKRSE